MDELDRLGGGVTDTVETARVLAAPLTQRKLNEKSIMCLTCFIAFGVDSVLWEGDWRGVT